MSAGFGESPFGSWPFGGGYPDHRITAQRIRILPLTVQRNRQIPIDAIREQVPMPVQATHERQMYNLAIARTIEPSPLATARGKQGSGIAVARRKKE